MITNSEEPDTTEPFSNINTFLDMFQQIEHKFIGPSPSNLKLPLESSSSAFTSTFEEPKKKQKPGTMSPLKERPRRATELGTAAANITSNKVQEILAKFNKQEYKPRFTGQAAFDFLHGANPELSKLKTKPKVVSKKSTDRTAAQVKLDAKEGSAKDKIMSSRPDPLASITQKEKESSISKKYSSSRFIFDYSKDKLWSRDAKAERSILQRKPAKEDKAGDKTFDHCFKPLKTKKKSMPGIIDDFQADQFKLDKQTKPEPRAKIASLKQILKEKPLQTILRTETKESLALEKQSVTSPKESTALQMQNKSMNLAAAVDSSKQRAVASGSPKSKPRIKVFFNEKRSDVSQLGKESPKPKKPESPLVKKGARFSKMVTEDCRQDPLSSNVSASNLGDDMRSKSSSKAPIAQDPGSQPPANISNVQIINSNIYFPLVGFNPEQKKAGYIDIQMEDRLNRPKSPSKASHSKLSRVLHGGIERRADPAKDTRGSSNSLAKEKEDCYSKKQANKKSASLAPANGFHSPSRRDRLRRDMSKNKDDSQNASEHSRSLQIGSGKPRGERKHLVEYGDKLLNKSKQTPQHRESFLQLQSFKKTKSSRESIDVSKKNFKAQTQGQKSDSNLKPLASLIEDESALTEFTQIEEMVSRSMSRSKKPPLLDESVLMNSSMVSPILSYTKKIFSRGEHSELGRPPIGNEIGLQILDSLKETFDLRKAKDVKIVAAGKDIPRDPCVTSPTGKSSRLGGNPKGPLYPISADKKTYYISGLQEALKGYSDPLSEAFLGHLKNTMVSFSYVRSIEKPHEDEFLSKRVYLPPLAKKGSRR